MILAAQVGFDDEEPVQPPRPPARRPQPQPNGNRSDDELPDYADDLPDIVVPRIMRVERPVTVRGFGPLRRPARLNRPNQPNQPGILQEEPELHFVVFHSHRRRNEMVRWNIQPARVPDDPTANVENTQRAVEEYYLRATRSGTDPSAFLEKYYAFERIPPLGKRLTLRHYCLFKTRVRCNRSGVRIPRMDAECQRQLFFHIQEGIADYASFLTGRDVEPRPPHIFNPILNVATGVYEHNNNN